MQSSRKHADDEHYLVHLPRTFRLPKTAGDILVTPRPHDPDCVAVIHLPVSADELADNPELVRAIKHVGGYCDPASPGSRLLRRGSSRARNLGLKLLK